MDLEIRKNLILDKLRQNKNLKFFEPLIPSGLGILGYLIYEGVGGLAVSGLVQASMRVIKEFSSKPLSNKERGRFEEMLDISYSKIAQKIIDGEILRDDNFLIEDPEGNSKIDEILDEVFGRAITEMNEIKLKHLGDFFVNLVFIKNLSKDEALRLLKVYDSLSLRQLQLLELMNKNKSNKYNLKNTTYKETQNKYEFNVISILQEILELYEKEFIVRNDYSSKPNMLFKYWHNLTPSDMVLTKFGKQFYNSFNLGEISNSNFKEMVELLRK